MFQELSDYLFIFAYILSHFIINYNFFFFFFNDTATTEIYTLSLHDALPICWQKVIDRFPAAKVVLMTATPFRSDRQELNGDRKSTRLNSSHSQISYAVFCLKKKKNTQSEHTPPLTSISPVST